MKRQSILMVSEGRGPASSALTGVLRRIGATTVVPGRSFERALDGARFDLIVIDDGTMSRALATIAASRKKEHTAAVVVVKDDISWLDARALFRAGAYDVIPDPPATWAEGRRLASSLRACLHG